MKKRYDTYMDIRTIENQLQHIAECHNEIDALYVFGSVLFKENPEDIDIAVLVNEKKIENSIYPTRYIGSLTSELMDGLRSDAIDLVLLNRASPVICMQVLRKGTMVYERDRQMVVAFSMRTIGRYQDLTMMRKPIEQQILRGRIYG